MQLEKAEKVGVRRWVEDDLRENEDSFSNPGWGDCKVEKEEKGGEGGGGEGGGF